MRAPLLQEQKSKMSDTQTCPSSEPLENMLRSALAVRTRVWSVVSHRAERSRVSTTTQDARAEPGDPCGPSESTRDQSLSCCRGLRHGEGSLGLELVRKGWRNCARGPSQEIHVHVGDPLGSTSSSAPAFCIPFQWPVM